MKAAIVGCLHGKLDQVYRDVANFEQQQGSKVQVIIVCGDFQAVRNLNDLKCMKVKDKYKELGDFTDYYWGRKQASHLTLVIGGNHEASNYMQTLAYGGWIAPNIYYLGYSNVLRFNGVRIAGLSGIFKPYSTNKGHHERLPYSQDTMASAYHTRYLEVYRMMQLKEKLDVMVTHDWPLHIYNNPGAKKFLINKKPHFRRDIDNHQLGSPLYEILLNKLKPPHWFAAHLHIRFQTNYFHQSFQNNFDNRPPNQSQPNGAPNSSGDQQPSTGESQANSDARRRPECTHFLALDKCLNRRRYLELVDIASDESNQDLGLEYDLEWLAILRATDSYVSAQEFPTRQLPKPHVIMNYDDQVESEKERIKELFNGDFKVPNNFAITLPLNSEGEDADPGRVQNYVNEQTTRLCELLGITDPMKCIVDQFGQGADMQEAKKVENPDRIEISDEDDCCGEEDSVSNLQSNAEDDKAKEDSKEEDKNKEDSDEPSTKRFKEEEEAPMFFIDTKGAK